MKFIINDNMLLKAGISLSRMPKLYWIVGGAGAGKTTVCRILSEHFGIPVYDMDAQIYGGFHSRFTQERHPINYAWANVQNGLEWLLNMTWEKFNCFNQAALPEYMDLLAEDVRSEDPQSPLLIDGGICNPGLLAKVLPTNQIVCLSRPQLSSEHIWEESEARRGMKEFILKLPRPDEAWCTFLEFDKKITLTILKECIDSNVVVCTRAENESPTAFSNKVAQVLGLQEP